MAKSPAFQASGITFHLALMQKDKYDFLYMCNGVLSNILYVRHTLCADFIRVAQVKVVEVNRPVPIFDGMLRNSW